MKREPIGSYPAHNDTGHAAYDKEGRTWPVGSAEASKLEQERRARNKQHRKPEHET
jgi:hypothetical protein